MIDLTQYIGIPYHFRTFNCWDLVVKIRANFGIKTKMFKPKTLKDSFRVVTAEMQKLDHNLTIADTPQNFDIIIAMVIVNGKRTYHTGVYTDGFVTHCCNLFGSVRQEPYASFTVKFDEVTIWR